MMNIHTEITINASPERVWKHLIDFDHFHEWNPFLEYHAGEIKVGQKILVSVAGMKFNPTIKVVDQEEKLEWLGSLIFPGIFDGRHTFELVDNGDGSTKFLHYEKFKGMLVPLFKKKLETETALGFESMNMALKKRVEA